MKRWPVLLIGISPHHPDNKTLPIHSTPSTFIYSNRIKKHLTFGLRVPLFKLGPCRSGDRKPVVYETIKNEPLQESFPIRFSWRRMQRMQKGNALVEHQPHRTKERQAMGMNDIWLEILQHAFEPSNYPQVMSVPSTEPINLKPGILEHWNQLWINLGIDYNSGLSYALKRLHQALHMCLQSPNLPSVYNIKNSHLLNQATCPPHCFTCSQYGNFIILDSPCKVNCMSPESNNTS